MLRLTVLFASLCLIMACSSTKQSITSVDDGYEKEIMKFRQDRLHEMKKPFGWTSVVGLYELSEGDNTFGGSEESDLVFPNAPARIGTLTMKGAGEVSVTPAAGVPVKINNEMISETTQLNSDMSGKPLSTMELGSLQWYVASRKERTFIRLKDTLSEYRQELVDIPSYPTNRDYIIKAKFIPAQEGDSMRYNTRINVEFDNPVKGYAEFDWQGETHRVTLLPGGTDTYFLLFADETTGMDTYGGGRFLYPKKEDANGMITLDFNKAENPPCVFTPYATCPLPPKQNHLKMKVEAGEKMLYLF